MDRINSRCSRRLRDHKIAVASASLAEALAEAGRAANGLDSFAKR